MQCTPQQLKDKLLKGLDKDYNVIDMSRVLEVISRLEAYPVTREVLQTTRIGKYINELRKKTENKDLAKRAKSLVRKWQQLVQGETVNGEGIASVSGKLSSDGSPMISSPALPALQRLSPRLPGSRPDTPCSSKSSISPALSRPDTPVSQLSVSSSSAPYASRLGTSKPASPALVAISRAIQGVRNASPQLPRTPPTATTRKRPANNDISDVPIKRQASLGTNTKATDAVQLTDLPGTKNATVNGLISGSSYGQVDDISTPKTSTPKDKNLASRRNACLAVKTDVEKMTPGLNKTPRTSKVKTTAELLADLQAKSESPVLASSAMVTRIARNMIKKEVDPSTESVVPASARPRPRRKPGDVIHPPSSSENSLSLTKTQMVEKFLLDIPSPFKEESTNNSESLTLSSDVGQSSDMLDYSMEPHSQLSTRDIDSAKSLVQSKPVPGLVGGRVGFTGQSANGTTVFDEKEVQRQWLMLPELDVNEILREEEEYQGPQEQEVTSDMVDRLHTDHWEGVNGQFDHNRQWHDWTSTYAMPSYGGDMLYILPYVDIDD